MRDQLKEKGFSFKSETDTEVLVQLIEYMQQKHNCNLVDAVRLALKKCYGAYAIVIIDQRNPNQIVAARKASPMVIGVGQDNEEFYIASDATPIAEYTKKVLYVDDEQVVAIERGKELEILDLDATHVDVQLKERERWLSSLHVEGDFWPTTMFARLYAWTHSRTQQQLGSERHSCT